MATATLERPTEENTEKEYQRKRKECFNILYEGGSATKDETVTEPSFSARTAEYTAVSPKAAPRSDAARPRHTTASATATTAAPKRILFEGITFKNGELVSDVPVAQPAPSAPAQAQVQAPVAPAPVAPAVPAPEDEDARPTTRTMATLHAHTSEAPAVQTGFWSALSRRAKIALLSIAAAIVLAVIVVCINTSILSSLNASVQRKQEELNGLVEQSEALREEIESVTAPETVRAWAEEHGMTNVHAFAQQG